MARKTDIRLRRSATTGAIPTTSNLNLGEIALNTFDGKLYTKTTESSFDQVVQVGSSTDSYHKIRKSQNISLTVKVITKTSDHAHHGSGSSSAYEINGVESPHFHLVPGNTYRFDQSDSSNSGHPLRFYYEADRTTAYTTGVTIVGTPGSSGAYTQIIPADSTPVTLHYQCSAHGYMGNRVDFGTRNLTGFDTDDLSEGSSNLYFTNARARSAISVSGDLSYNSSTGVISFSETSAATTRALISVTDAGGDGSLAYNNSTGVITYTGPSAAETRAHFSGGTGVTISTGTIAIGQDVGTSATPTFGNTTVGSRLTFGYNSHYLEAGTNALAFKNSSGNPYINITSTGVTIPGNLTVEGTTTTLNTATLDVEDKNITLNYGSGDTSASANGAGITIQDAVDSSTDATILWNTTKDAFEFSHDITLPDTAKLEIGNLSGGDLFLNHNGNHSFIQNQTGNLYVVQSTDDGDIVFQTDDGSGGTATYITIDGSAHSTLFSKKARWSDNIKAAFGGSDDLQVYHDGTHSYIVNATNSLYLRTASTLQIENADGSEDLATFGVNGAVTLFYDNSAKVATTSTGIQTTGTVNVNGAYTLPTSDGTSGQVLQTDGSGTLSFATVSGGGGGTVSEAFKNIAVSGQSNIVADSATDTLTFAAGSGIQLTTTPGTDTLTITSTATGSVTEAFKTIAVSGSSDIVADSATDTLTLVAGSNMTITQNASSDTITFASSGSGSGAAASDILKRFTYTTSGNTTAFTGADDNSQTLSYTLGAIQVYLNGVLQELTTDYVETNTSTITFVNTVASGNVVEIVAYYRTIGTGNSVVNQFTGDGSTTAFTVTTAPVSENNLLVYIDGVYQQKTDYTTSGTTLTMDTAPASGATIETVCSVGAITEQTDLTLSGSLQVADVIEHVGDTDTEIVFDTNDIKIKAGGATHFHASSDQKTQLMSGNATTMVLDTSQNVGIGTTSPQGRLHIEGAAGASGGGILYITDADNGSTASDALQISKSGDTAFVYNRESSGNLQIGAGNDATHLVVRASGKIGLGVTSPGVGLDVSGHTDAIRVPNGTTAQRPTAALGQLRYNTTTSQFEGYAAGAWGAIGGGGDAFGTIAVSGQSNVVADQENDTLTFEAGAGIVITTDASSDKVTISGGSGSVFTTDLFTASGSGSALLTYTLSTTPSSENELIVFIEGVYQNKNSYALSGTTLTFDSGIVSGQEIVVHHVGAGVVGVSPTIDTFTGNGSTAAYTLSVAPPNENYLAVFWDGVYQHHSEYSVSGTTLTFTTNVPSSTAVEVYIPSVNGIGTPSDATVTPAKLSTGGPQWDTSSNFIVGSHYQRSDSTSMSTTSATTVATHSKLVYRSVNYKVQITQGTAYQVTEANVIHDGSSADITEFGTLFTGSNLGTLSTTITGNFLYLQFTTASNATCVVKVMSTATTL